MPDQPLSIKDMMTDMRDVFNIYCNTEGNERGGAFVCSDLVHLWKLLWDGAQGLKILIMYNGETIRGEFGISAPLGRVDRRFLVVVSRGRGLKFAQGDSLITDNGNARPLFEVVEEVRDICRAFMFDPNWSERPVDYSGVSPFATMDSGRIIDAYQIEFSVGVQLAIIVEEPDEYAGLPQNA